jgi:DNA-binding response OmpR family regulator
VHAESADLQGEEALIALMRMNKGTFQEVPWYAPEPQTIDLPFDSLMIGIASLIDEEQKLLSEAAAHSEQSILVLEPELQQREMLKKFFSIQGYPIEGVTTAQEAFKFLAQNSCDLILSSFQIPDMTAQAFLEQLQSQRRQSKVILFGKHLSRQVRDSARRWGALRCYQKPVILGELEAFVRYLFSQRFFSGKLRNLGIVDFLQGACFGKGSKTFRIHDLALNLKGYIYLEDGAIVHAALDHLSGEAAFQAILRIQRGLLSQIEQASPEQSIDAPLTRLIMRAMLPQTSESGPLPAHNPGTLQPHPEAIEAYLARHPLMSQLVIYTQPAEFAGLRLGRSSQTETQQALDKLGGRLLRLNEHEFSCPEFSLSLRFNSASQLEELHFGSGFRGRTHAGIGIGDDLQQAIFVYGKPRFQDQGFCVWEQVAFLSEGGKINEIILGAI